MSAVELGKAAHVIVYVPGYSFELLLTLFETNNQIVWPGVGANTYSVWGQRLAPGSQAPIGAGAHAQNPQKLFLLSSSFNDLTPFPTLTL
jgi:hypothetical protein